MNMLQRLQKTVSAKAISMLLVVSMLFGALPANTVLVANAAGETNLRIHLMVAEEQEFECPALNVWGDSVTVSENDGTVDPGWRNETESGNWGTQVPIMTKGDTENDITDYSIEVKGNIAGMQILDVMTSDSNLARYQADVWNEAMAAFTDEEPTDLYAMYDKDSNTYTWYTDKDCTELLVNDSTPFSPIYNADGTVTFNLKTDATVAKLKGMFTGWDTISMNQVSEAEAGFDGFTLTMDVPLEAGLYEYGMVTGAEDAWQGDPANPTKMNNALVVRNPKVDNGVVTIYYPTADKKVEGNVLYRVAGSDAEYAKQPFRAVNGATGLFAAEISDAEANVEYEYLVQIGEEDATYDAYNWISKKGEGNEITTTFTATKAIEKPEFTSPVINEDGTVTFNYWAPAAKEVKLAGAMNGWSGEAMTKNEETGLFSITKTLGVGSHGYKFVVDGAWVTDPENTEYDGDGNSVVVAPIIESEFKSPVYNEDGTVTFNLKTDETVAKLKGMFTGWATVSMNQVSGNDVDFVGFTLTTEVPFEAGLYEYGMVTGAEDAWQGDPANPTTKGNPVVVRNPKVDNGVVTIYYPTADKDFEGNVLYRVAGSDAEYAKQPFSAVSGATGLFAAEISDAEANVEYEYLVQIGEEDATYDAYNWINRNVEGATPTTTFTSTKAIAKPEFTSPVINEDGTVTFNYWAPSAKEVKVAGAMNGWAGEAMTKNEENGLFSITLSLDAGPQEYKFIVDGNWVTDPENDQESNGNSVVVVPAPETGLKSPVLNEDGTVTFNLAKEWLVDKQSDDSTTVSLMGTLTDWDKGAEMTYDEEAGIFTITMTLAPGTYKYKFRTPLSQSSWYADPLNTDPKDGDGNSVVVVPASATEIVLKADNMAGIGPVEVIAELPEGSVIDVDSIQWSVSDNDLGDITLTPDSTDKTKAVVTADKDTKSGNITVSVTYTANGEECSAQVQIYHTKKAYLYEYVFGADSEFVGKTDIYVWYNSQAGNIGYPLKDVNGEYVSYITLDDKTSNFGYIARLFGDWGTGDREYGDRTLYVNTDDLYTKVKGGEGIQDAYLLPTGKTTYDNGIKFAYRDDARFYNNTMDELKDVDVKVCYKLESEADYTKADMTYSELDELFTCHIPANKLAEGEYDFYFTVDGEKVEDQYMDGKIEFRKPTLNVKATVTPEEADYDMNPVVSFDITTDMNIPSNSVSDIISSITADLSELGYEGMVTNFSATSLSGVLYIDRSVAAGTYNVPCTITDIWGNTTSIDVPVKVVARTAATPSWDESNIYFLLTDRFADGDRSNNSKVNKGKIEAYHGGDFKGLTSKLPYLQNLGINTIWITPIVDNIEEITNKDLHQQAYHGYWAKDFTKIDEHLGTTEDLNTLIDEAAKRGIKIMVDIVVNHAGYNTKDNENFKGMLRTDEELIEGDVILGELDHLPDFKTEEQAVRAQLVAWQTAWANHETPNGNRIAYFRVDTVKHVDHETWAELKTSVAKENPTFKMIGEYYGASINNTGDYLGNGQMDAVLDFDFKSQAASFISGEIGKTEAALETRNRLLSSGLTTGQFLSSHDEDGFLAVTAGGDTAKAKVAAALQLTAKGVPVIYYGEEIALSGPNEFGNQNNNRYDMQFDNLSEEQKSMLSHYQKLLAARNMYTDVFAAGNRETISVSENGYSVFKRSTAAEEVFVGLNVTSEPQEVTFSVSGNDVLFDAYSGEEVEVKDGKVTVTIPANSNGGTVILGAKKAVGDITVVAPNKTAYKLGEELDLTGLAVSAYYGGSRVAIQPGQYTVDTSKYNKNVAGTYEIVVTYGEFSKKFNVSVAEENKKPVEPEQPKEIAATGVTLSATEASIERGKELKLTATVAPANATNKAVVFTSDNDKVATVTSDGVVKAVATGSANITVTTINGKSATCKVTVIVSATNVFVNQSFKIQKGKTLQLTATVLPADTTEKLTWKSSNTSKVTVDANGKIKAVATGSATITVMTDSGKKATCKVTVVKKAVKAKKVTVKKAPKTMNIGDVKQLKVTVKPASSTDVVTFKSSKKSVISVDKNGVMTAKKPGTAKITVKAGSKKTTIKVTVKQPATDIALNKTAVTITKGKTFKLKATLTPKNSTDKVTYKSSKKSVATVSKKGVITAKKKGTATITVKTASGKKATCKVTVK